MPAGPPGSHAQEGPRPTARDYTPRRFDAERLELDLDFVLHGDGPATSWAAQASVGQWLGVGGPRGSQVVSDDFDWYLLMGDETALPAIARRLEQLRPEARAMAIIEVEHESEEQPLSSAASLSVQWLHRQGASPGEPQRLLAAVQMLVPPPEDGYVWIACESNVARTLRSHLIEREFNKEWIKAAGYWKRGAIATHETHTD